MTEAKRGLRPAVRVRRHVGTPARTIVVLSLAAVTIAVGLVVLRATPGVTPSIEPKIVGIALAVGLDVLALSIALGIMQIAWASRLRLGAAFCAAEVVMQLAGYAIGTGAGHVIGAVATYIGFVILAIVGGYIVYESTEPSLSPMKIDTGWGMIVTAASVSLDSLGIGVSLPGVPLPLVPLLATVAVSTIVFTAVGLTFGDRLGTRYEVVAQRIAGIVLILLAIFFTVQHVAGFGH